MRLHERLSLNLLLLVHAILSLPVSVRSQPSGVVIPLSEEDAGELLATHNFLRGVVDPSASNMQTLVREEVCVCRGWGGGGGGGGGSRTEGKEETKSFLCLHQIGTCVRRDEQKVDKEDKWMIPKVDNKEKRVAGSYIQR